MQRMCVRSYQVQGHEFHLYTYGDVEGVPEGVILKDGCDIMPPLSECGWCPNMSHFGDFFRYELLLKMGCWVVDMDTVCLKSFDFEEEHVLAGEYFPEPPPVRINGNVIKAPVGSYIVKHIFDKCRVMDLMKDHHWGRTGPEAITDSVAELGVESLVKPPQFFNPVPHTWVPAFINPNSDVSTAWKLDDAYCLHWWAGGWQSRGMDLDATYSSECLYERMKARYL